MPDPNDPLGFRLRDYARAELTSAAEQLAREGEARHTGVHQVRKRLRRARATLALARRPLGGAGRRLDDALGQACRGLCGLRDAQALVEALARLEATAPAGLREQLPDAIALATARRDAVMAAALVRDPGFERHAKRLRALAARLGRLDWTAVDEAVVAKGVARSERRLAKARRRAERAPGDDERWHVLRRRLRRLRQQDHLLVSLAPELRPVEGASTEEATTLGEAQDDVLLLRACGRGSPFPVPMRRELRTLAGQRLRQVRGLADDPG
ncbi:CHAD domain-containing protein [Arenimonas sp.]|uniref:CHAD domain-containing protein n=1 Tax=Arenimonas sp. TaxID=1872635 RepID=UPI0035B42608